MQLIILKSDKNTNHIIIYNEDNEEDNDVLIIFMYLVISNNNTYQKSLKINIIKLKIISSCIIAQVNNIVTYLMNNIGSIFIVINSALCQFCMRS